MPTTGASGSFAQGLLGITLLVLGAISITVGGRRRLDSGG
ncbi:MAG: LPXTG cell wall anchor domain-containing protein [Chloroflexi bacterium]|nr:MAG: LPXTG cell wall anchor domain-containing protein [Chloroflexota bacterium]